MERGKEPEYLFSPDYWDRHDSNNKCCRNEASWKNQSREDLSAWLEEEKKKRQFNRFRDAAHAELQTLLKTGGGEPIRVYKQGDFFNGETYPLGTIIRIKEETLTKRLFILIPEYYSDTVNYGYLSSPDNTGLSDCFSLIYFPFFESLGLVKSPKYILPKLPLGEVRHMDTGLRRVNQIEIVAFGKPIRQPVREMEKHPSLDFVPETI